MSRPFGVEREATRDEAATVLRDVADGVSGGTLRFQDGDESFAVDVPATLELELEFDTDEGETSVEIELEWPGPAPTDADAARRSADETVTETDDSPVGPAEPLERLARFEMFRDRSDEWRWRLVHRNGNVIATSGEGYTRKHNAMKGVRSVMRNSSGATIQEESE